MVFLKRKSKKEMNGLKSDRNTVSGVLCDRTVSARIKGNYAVHLRDHVGVKKRQEAELELEMKMLRFSLGVMRIGRIRNRHVRWTDIYSDSGY